MTPIKVTFKNRQIVIDLPADWPPEGEVRVDLVEPRPRVGMREEDWPTTPEEVEELIGRWKAHEPLESTPEEFAAWKQALEDSRQWHKARFFEWANKLTRAQE